MVELKVEKVFEIPYEVDRGALFGALDTNLKYVEEKFGVIIINRNNELIIKSDTEIKIQKAEGYISELIFVIKKEEKIDKQKLEYIFELFTNKKSYNKELSDSEVVCYTVQGKPVKPKTVGQKKYVESMNTKDIVFCIGPAGTGKTYLAVSMAIKALKKKEIQKIILARPAVEAGERLGFLPGDLQEKVDPYLRPLYDALYDMLGRDGALRLKEKEIIEVVPLAYMRGRTLDNSFIILDEAQNTTREQMKMFLTRMGFESKAVITGDITQVDLPDGKKSGLAHAIKILKNVHEIDFCYLKAMDVVRHPLVKKIIDAYEKHHSRNEKHNEKM